MHEIYFKNLHEAAKKKDFDNFEKILIEAKSKLSKDNLELFRDKLFKSLKIDIKNGSSELFNKNVISIMVRLKFKINYRDEKKRTLFDYAILAQNTSAAKILIEEPSFDPNIKSKNGTSLKFLIKFLSKKRPDLLSFSRKDPMLHIVVQLMNHPKINLKELYNPRYSLIALLAKFFRVEDLEGLSGRNIELMHLLKEVTFVGHCFGLRGKVDVEGYRCSLGLNGNGIAINETIQTYDEFIFNKEVVIELNAFLNLLYETKEIDYFEPNKKDMNFFLQIKEDLACMTRQISLQEFQERDKNNKITPFLFSVNVEEGNHAIGYLFTPEFCIKINSRGTQALNAGNAGKDITPGIRFYKIGNKPGFLKEIPTILNEYYNRISESYLDKEFLIKCQLRNVHEINRPIQKVSNCTMLSLLDTIYTLFVLYLYKHFSKTSPTPTRQASLAMAEKLATPLNNLFLCFDKERGMNKLKAIEKYLGTENIQKINKRTEEAWKTHQEQSLWTPSFTGIKMEQGVLDKKPEKPDCGDQKVGFEKV